MKRGLIVAAFAAGVIGSACGHDWSQFEPSSGAGGSGGSSALCGDGHLDPGEECDDGNMTDGDGCTACKVDCDTAHGAFSDPKTHHCYWIVNDQAQWMAAQGNCSGPGSVAPAALSTTKELGFVQPHLGDTTWLGGAWSFSAMNWAWSNGEPWRYGDDQMGAAAAPWSTPHNDKHRFFLCVVAQTDGTIDARGCFEDHPVLCERTPTIAQP